MNTELALSRAELGRYSRPLLVPEWQHAGAQEKVKASRVLVVGAGGLGGPVILQLAGAGVGTLTVAEPDTVALSNLHRQTLYGTADVGRPKAEVACARAQQLNPFVAVQPAPQLSTENAAALVKEHDLIIDATDNAQSRYAIADACQSLGKISIWGAASGTTGMVSVFGPWLGLRDIFPLPDEAESCQETGVLGPVPQIVGSLMALQALLILGEVGEPLKQKLWTFDAQSNKTRVIQLAHAAQ